MTVVKVNIDMTELPFSVVCRELLDRIENDNFSDNSDLYKKLVKKISDDPVSFEEACEVVLDGKDDNFRNEVYRNLKREIIDEFLEEIDEENEPESDLLVDVWKDEMFEKIREKFTLEEIEKFYESKH